MRSPFFAAILSCIAVLAYAPSIAADNNQCGLKQFASIDLMTVRENQLLVPVVIQDTPAYMTLALSNAFSGIGESSAHDLSLAIQSTPANVGVRAGGNAIKATATAR